MYYVMGTNHLKQMFSAPEDQLSFVHAVAEVAALPYTFNQSSGLNHWHSPLIRRELPRHSDKLMDDILAETRAAFDEEMAEVTNGISSSVFAK
jgi:hypothetical protein